MTPICTAFVTGYHLAGIGQGFCLGLGVMASVWLALSLRRPRRSS